MMRSLYERLPVLSRTALAAWCLFYLAFLAYALRNTSGFLFIDYANLVVHEGGHMLFSYCGEWLCVAGGTIFQWLVPLLLAAGFYYKRETAGVFFSLYFFFENWLYTAAYMADARAQALPLVSVGGGEALHDWNYLFSSMHCLDSDLVIAHFVHLGGLAGMFAVLILMILHSLFGNRENASSE